MEYKLFNRKESRFELKNKFSRKHRATLNALAHDQYYFYKEGDTVEGLVKEINKALKDFKI